MKLTRSSWLTAESRSQFRAIMVRALLTLGACSAAGTAAAEVTLQVRYWDYRLEGSTTDRERLDFQRDLAARTGDRVEAALWWKPSAAWAPEVGYQYGPLDVRGQQSETVRFALLGIPLFQQTREALIDADLDNQSLTLRYPVSLSSRQRLHPGLTVRDLRGVVVIRDADDVEADREAIDEWFPQLHLGWDWQPYTELRLRAVAEWIEVSGRQGDRLEVTADWQAGGGPWVLSVGWAHQGYRFTAGDDRVNARFAGPFAGLGLRW